MKFGKMSAFILALSMVATLVLPLASFASAKRRVAVLPFSYGSVSSEVGSADVGKGIVSLIITRLVNDGTYSVCEREMMDSILKEQNLSTSDRADAATAAKIGKLLGVDAIIVGTVTQFGFENHNTNVGAPLSVASGYIPFVGGLGMLGGLSVHKQKVKVAIDARIIDINTGEILGAVNGASESHRSGASMYGGDWGGNWWDSSNFASSIAGEATLAAVDQLTGQLTAMSAKIPDNQSIAADNVQGKIADVTGTTVIVNVGKNNGLKVGDHLQAERITKTVKDPSTGKVLKEVTSPVGVITLTDVDAGSATGDVVRGSNLIVGDNVKKLSATTDVSAVLLTPTTPSTSSNANASADGKKTAASLKSKTQ
jgi:curli biogenesis system outer membrane secretion channel CsgG